MAERGGVGAVILAAGASCRLGTPKQTVMLNGETLLDRAVRVARGAGAAEIVVVLGAFAEQIRGACRLGGCRVVVNGDWQEGMRTSIRAGIGALGPVSGALLMTCDMPRVPAAHLRRLAGSAGVTASFYGGGAGVPAYFPAGSFPALAGLRGRGGAKELLAGAEVVELAGGELDIDTAEDVARLRAG